MKTFKVIVEKHASGYVAYPLGISGAVVGQGLSYDGASADVKSAIAFHLQTFGDDEIEGDSVLEAFVPEASVLAG